MNKGENTTKLKSNKGITLVALVVTIIVLIILAGVTINLVLGDNGIIQKAKEAKLETEIGSIKEKIQMDIAAEQAANQGSISDNALKTILENYGTIKYEEDGTTIKSITTNEGNYEIEIADLWSGRTSENVEPVFTKVANAPDISGFNQSTTYYVSWDLTSSPYVINDTTAISGTAPSNWYDYTEGVNKWANVKTTGGGNDCYWVWIPRYAYKVPNRSAAQTIEVKFLKGKTNIPIGETEAITNTTPTQGEWVVHPAFTNSGNGGLGDLTGIWVAKYEASSSIVSEETLTADLATNGGGDTTSLQVRVKPNVTSWRGITVGNIFTVCQNLTKTVDGKENSLVGSSKLDSHMMKNTEWGAVAYLSSSKYGKKGQVYNNPYYNNTTNYSPITGLCGNNQNASQTSLTNTYKYNTAEGVNASTSGNVYGIYDMAGGVWEYVAGILSSKKSNSTYYDFSKTDTKYYDNYDSYDNTKYGDAVYETSTSSSGTTSWNTDYSNFVLSSNPVFLRGGNACFDSGSGVFAFSRHEGNASTTLGFRPCLVSPQ